MGLVLHAQRYYFRVFLRFLDIAQAKLELRGVVQIGKVYVLERARREGNWYDFVRAVGKIVYA